MKPTIENILRSAKILLSHLEEIDENGVTYYNDEEAKYLHNLIEEYESEH